MVYTFSVRFTQMATTTNTLPHDTYANQTIPLWATAKAGQQFNSPSVVVNDVEPSTAGLTTFVSDDATTASFTFNTIPAGTPMNEIEFSGVNGGIALKTNGEYTLATAPNETAVLGDLNIISKQTGGVWSFQNNELSYNGYKQLTGDATYSQLGSNTYSDSFGLNVWNVSSFNNTSTVNDTNLSFYTSTGGSSNNITYSFVSELVPNTASGNPDLRTANARTPQFPNDVDYYGYNAQSVVSIVSGGSGVPYTINISNSGGTSSGIGARMTQLNGDTFRSSTMPFWFEVTMFDPGSVTYELDELGGLFSGTGELMKEIKNVAGALTFVPLGFVSPQPFVVGDKLRFIFEWSDPAKTLMRVLVSKNNTTLSVTNSTIVGNIRQFSPNFFTTTGVVSGFNYNLTLNYGITSPILTSFNDWEWNAGLGGLYGYNNSAIKPANSGSAPSPTTYYSIVYLQNNGEFTSPPINTTTGVTYTISAYYGSRFGTGNLQITQNNTNLGSVVPPPAWTQGTLATFVGTGSDTLRFIFTGTAGDFFSIQRINLAFNDAVDTLVGGIGKSGTSIVMGASSNFVASPDIQLTTSNIVVNKPISMGSNALIGNINTNSITPISPATSIAVGNLNMSNNTISNASYVYTSQISPNAPSSNISVGGNLAMSSYNISNAGTLSATNTNGTYLNATSNVRTPNLDGLSIGTELFIGYDTFQTRMSNVYTIYGRSASYPLYLGLCDQINSVSAIPTGTIWIQTNFGGFRQLGIPLIPTWTRSDTLCYPLAGDNYTGTQGYTISGHSVLTIFDTGLTILEQHSNFGETPQFYAGTQMILNTNTRLYHYRVNLN